MSNRWAYLLVVVLCVAVGIFVFSEKSGQETFALLTEEEVLQRDEDPFARSTEEPQKERSLSITSADGPKITVTAPSGYSLVPPVDIDVVFEPRDGSQVDMQTLRIDYKMGPAWLNITQRVKANATIKGTRLLARNADLPKGNHKLRFSIRDANNRTTRAQVTFSVKN